MASESRSDALTQELVTSRLMHENLTRKEQGNRAKVNDGGITSDNVVQGTTGAKGWPLLQLR